MSKRKKYYKIFRVAIRPTVDGGATYEEHNIPGKYNTKKEARAAIKKLAGLVYPCFITIKEYQ